MAKEVPRSIEGVMTPVRISGADPLGCAVYACRVAYRSSAPREMVLHTTDGKSDDEAPKKVAVHGVDKRGTYMRHRHGEKMCLAPLWISLHTRRLRP